MNKEFEGTKRILFCWAGLSGAVIERQLAEAGHEIVVLDERNHIAGNCPTERDSEVGVMVHICGAHIFHIDHG
ncbi:NAD(P)-binding protein [Ensifer sp. ENS01]|nr:NAD(P)-binding protein [Ensifer sp. ENS01]